MIFSLGTAGFLGIIYSGEPVEESVEIYNSDFNSLAEAKLKKDAYETRTKKELNYSTNIVALELGEIMGLSSSDGWSSGIPSYGDLKSGYLETVTSELRSQNGVIGCSSPQIDSLSGEIPQSYTVDISDASITCETREVNGISPSSATVNLTETSYNVLNSDNRYLSLAKYSVGFAEKIETDLNGRSSVEASGSDSISCEDSGSKSVAESNAKSDAISNVEAKLPDLDTSLYSSDSGDRSSWINRESSSRDLTGSIVSGSVSSSSSPCTYQCGTDSDGDPIMCTGKTYSADAKAYVDSTTLEYTLVDSERKVINSTGDQERIKFYFEKKFDFGSD